MPTKTKKPPIRAPKRKPGKPARAGTASNGRAPKPHPTPRAAKAGTVRVKTPGRGSAQYDVLIGTGLIHGAANDLLEPGAGVLIVIDSHLGSPLVEPLLRELDRARARWGVCVAAATEHDKSLTTAERALAEAARLRIGRDGLVIGLGGGIVTDVAGFVAASFKRGIRIVQCPTSLLAMVDAAVGGKTAVNLIVAPSDPGQSDAGKPRLVKNAVGAFHQPTRVVCDIAALETLPPRELRCGLAECFKHGMIAGGVRGLGDAKLLDWTEKSLDRILAGDPAVLAELVKRNVALKARVVAGDPFEESNDPSGGRMMLNLGHTFAHAFETLPGLSWPDQTGQLQIGPLKHGEAVGLGLLAAARLSESLRLLRPPLSERIHVMLHRAGLPTRLMGLPASEALVARMLDDKKAKRGKIRLILPVNGHRCRVVTEPASEAVESAIDSLRAGK
jgi:3-dehydroquinate synthase